MCTIAQTKYSNVGYMLSAQEWRNVYKVPFQCLKDPTLLWFQYRILHRIITTNTFLYKIKYIESNICELCHSQPETLEHLFFDCPKVLDVWKGIELWIQDKGEHIKCDKQKYVLYKNCQFEEFDKYWALWSRFLKTRHVNILK